MGKVIRGIISFFAHLNFLKKPKEKVRLVVSSKLILPKESLLLVLDIMIIPKDMGMHQFYFIFIFFFMQIRKTKNKYKNV